MAISISYADSTSYVAISGTSSNLVFGALPTSQPIIIEVLWDYGSSVPSLGSFSLATDGAPDDVTAQIVGSSGKGAIYLYWDNCTDATQALSYTNSGSYVEGLARAYTVSGHDTAAPFGTETTDDAATTLNFTFGTTGNALMCHFIGTTSTALTFSEGTWSYDTQANFGVSYWSTDMTAGTKSISILGGVPGYAAMVEIKAAAGSSVSPMASYYRMMQGA